jgi:site-specific recombinase XerD
VTAQPLAVLPDGSDWTARLESWRRSLRGRGLTERSIQTYLVTGASLGRWCLARPRPVTDPVDVTRDHLEEYLEHLQTRITRYGRKASPAAVAKEYRGLKVMFKWLAEREDIKDPMTKIPAPLVPDTVVDTFADDELAALLAACKGRGFSDRRDHALIRVLLDTGVRLSELAGMTVASADLNLGLITVSRETSKGRRDRLVVLSPKTADALDAYVTGARRRHPDRELDALWLAGSPHRGQLGVDGVRLLLQRRGRLAGITGKVNPHRFRHTAAHQFLLAGGREGEAMTLFGWKSRSMVDRYGASGAQVRAIATAQRLARGDRV